MNGTRPDDVLSCAELTLRVPGRTLVDRLDLTVRPGRVLAVLGRNGAGKSTTLHALAGLRYVVNGEVRLGGRPLQTWSRREIARRVGLLPQANEDPFPATALDTVLVGRHPHLDFWRWETDADREIARRDAPGIDEAQRRHFHRIVRDVAPHVVLGEALSQARLGLVRRQQIAHALGT